MSSKKIRRQATIAAECVLTMATVRAESLYESKLAGEDISMEAVDLLTVLALAGQLQDTAEVC